MRVPLWAVALLVACVGCGPEGPEIVPVTGTVLQNGQPVSNASITFYAAQGRPSYGTSDANGNYSLEYSRDVEGAVVGSHTVVVTMTSLGPPPAVEAGAPSSRRAAPTRGRREGGPMEVTLPEPVVVSADTESLDLVLP
ncbi:carboxypeptidase-like regulatory domain-containing protein [Rhodopirellula sallentina]|uniref:carboxypeptidase-like regulatory domain-containing protein n=1 Tax=Rhodopirellula sallentina TaxID=1263869 RepID=UPI001181859A|nr:carboxypeptidase-like regulatory domain-containing protein [Rhodopirellula sallentina]